MSKTAVLAYSGGLDTSCAIAWLKEDYGFDEVVAVLVDVGQDADFEPAFARGYAAGADDVILLDRKDAFADDQVAKALLANALYEGKYPLISALSRPVIAEAVAGDRARARRRGGRARLHRQGQRPAALRARLQGEVPGREGDRAAPRQDRGRATRRSPTPRRAGSRSRRSRRRRTRSTTTCSAARSRPACSRTRGSRRPRTRSCSPRSPADAPAPVEVVVGFEQGVPVSLDGDGAAAVPS